jgi:tRNA(adenine34) deaminase
MAEETLGIGEASALPAMSFDEQDKLGMRLALDQALNAQLVGEVPVGAVVMRRDADGLHVVATGYNRPITTHDPTAHAEIVALRQAAEMQGNYRLPDVEVYVTLEPCAMCAMALLHARVKRVVFGAHDPKTGAAGSVLNLFDNAQLNHQTTLVGGVEAAASGQLLRQFFAERRAAHKGLAAPTALTPASTSASASVSATSDDDADAPMPLPQVIEDSGTAA